MSLSERAHLNIRPLRHTTYSLAGFIIFLLGFVSLFLFIWVGTHNELRKYGTFVNAIPFLPNEKFTPFNEAEFPTM
jgi:hypothetical protein